jgi:nucleotide-binding universal stress UspA family protein
MLPIKTILHPTDFSEQSAQAFRAACALASDYGARLVVTHVLPLPLPAYGELGPLAPDLWQIEDEMRQSLQALRPPDPAVAVEYRLGKGDAAMEVVALAEEVGADLIVMGTHGRTGLGRLAVGSVAEAVLRRAPCPVLTMKVAFLSAVVPEQPVGQPAHA